MPTRMVMRLPYRTPPARAIQRVPAAGYPLRLQDSASRAAVTPRRMMASGGAPGRGGRGNAAGVGGGGGGGSDARRRVWGAFGSGGEAGPGRGRAPGRERLADL